MEATEQTRKHWTVMQNIHCEVSKWPFNIWWLSEQHGLSSSAVLPFLLKTWALQVMRMISGFVQDSWRGWGWDCLIIGSFKGRPRGYKWIRPMLVLMAAGHGETMGISFETVWGVSLLCPHSVTLLPLIPQEQRSIPSSSIHLLYIYHDGSHLPSSKFSQGEPFMCDGQDSFESYETS